MASRDLYSLYRGLRRARFYAGSFVSYYLPDCLYRLYARLRFALIGARRRRDAMSRVDYYVRLEPGAAVPDTAGCTVGEFRYPYGQKHKLSAYFFDLYQSVRCFDKSLRFCYLFGDINYTAAVPTFVKSRPVTPRDCHTDSVLCRLNRIRHFTFVRDRQQWRDKQDMLIFRNVVRDQPWRTLFIERAMACPLCDAGQTNTDCGDPAHVKGYVPVYRQLSYKFIGCIEGNDVATNLKWVMSSNSIAVMPRPKIESWFMEGTLVGGYHYIEIKEDYSDLEEKLAYYLAHPDEAEAIIGHAHEYVRRFTDESVERYVQYNVVKRYFTDTGQAAK